MSYLSIKTKASLQQHLAWLDYNNNYIIDMVKNHKGKNILEFHEWLRIQRGGVNYGK